MSGFRFSFPIVLRYQHADEATKNEEAEAEEETEKPLGVATEIDSGNLKGKQVVHRHFAVCQSAIFVALYAKERDERVQ